MSINVFTASGNIGKDCEQRYTPAGKVIASFSLAIKSGYGEHEKTSWLTCRLFGVKAEKLSQYLLKGKKVNVTGEFVLEEWNDQQGSKRQSAVIIVNSIDFCSTGNQKPQAASPQDFDDQIPF